MIFGIRYLLRAQKSATLPVNHGSTVVSLVVLVIAAISAVFLFLKIRQLHGPAPGGSSIHATVLHQLGIDYRRLTCSPGGRDVRLTDVLERSHPVTGPCLHLW